MKDSQDLLTIYDLITDECEIERFRGWSTINLGCFSKEKHPEIFEKVASIFDLKPKVNKVYLNISNVEYFDFFDKDDKVNLLQDDAPKLCYGKKDWFNNGIVPLSKQDAITLAKFIIKEQQEIIEETKEIIKELEWVENKIV